MATKTKKAKPPEPAERPQNLKPLSGPIKEPPVPIPADDGNEATLKWMEDNLDHYEALGYGPSTKDMMALCEAAGLDEKDTKALKKQVKNLYPKLFAKEPDAPPKPGPAKGTDKAKAVMANAKAAKAKKAAKAAAKPSKNGHAGANGNGAARKRAPAEGKVILDAKVRGVPVRVVRKGDGEIATTAFGVSFRKTLMWMGAHGFTPAEGLAAVTSLVKGWAKKVGDWEDGAAYVRSVAADGWVGQGQKAGPGGVVWNRRVPEFPPEEAKALKALKALKK